MAILVIVVIIVGAVGFVSLAAIKHIQQSNNPPSPSTLTTTNSTNGTVSTVCIVQAEGAGTYLHIVSDSTQQPLSGVAAHVTPTATECLGTSRPSPFADRSNASGWISIGGLQANYYFELSLGYAGKNYSFSLPQGPESRTYATLRLPSANLSITLCYMLANPPSCRPYNQTAVTSSGSYRTTSSVCITPTQGSERIVNCSSPSATYTTIIKTGSQWTNISSSGLELLVVLNATRVISHGTITARIMLYDSLDTNLTLLPRPANYSFSNCDLKSLWSTVGYALFKGHYTPANISSAGHPLSLVPPIRWSCITWPGPNKFVFLPRSSSVIPISGGWAAGQAIVNVTTDYGTGDFCCRVGAGLFGYWDSTCCLDIGEATTTSSTQFHYFSPGQYTLFVEDMWNQTIYAYFQVS